MQVRKKTGKTKLWKGLLNKGSADKKAFGKALPGGTVFAAALFGYIMLAGNVGSMRTVNAAAADDTSTSEDVQIGDTYWTESRGNIIYPDVDGRAAFYTEDIRQLGLAIQEVERMAGNQGIYNPGDVDENGNPRKYSVTARDVLSGKTFFNANKEDGAGADVGTMPDFGCTEKAGMDFRLSASENLTPGEEGYTATGKIRIPEDGYYNTDSMLNFDLTENNKFCYNEGYRKGIADTIENAAVEEIRHHHTDACGGAQTCTYKHGKYYQRSSVFCNDCDRYMEEYVYYFEGHTCGSPNRAVRSYMECPKCGKNSGDKYNWDAFVEGTFTHTYNVYTCGYEENELMQFVVTFPR